MFRFRCLARLSACSLLALAACGAPTDDDSGDDLRLPGIGADAGAGARDVGADAAADVTDAAEVPPEEGCVDNEDFFNETLWPELLQPVCGACHTPQGIGRDSELVFVSAAVPTYLRDNLAMLDEVSRLERDGISLLLLKPTAQVTHGGGEVLTVDSEGYALLEAFIARRDDPVVCEDEGGTGGDEALVLLDDAETLRKASLQLVGRLPSDDARASVEAGGELSLRSQLDQMLREEAFYDTLRVMFNDAWLTDRYLPGQNAVQQLDDDLFPERYWFDAIEDDGLRNRYRNEANDAIARQPIELAVHLVRSGYPFTDVLTADYTMVNAYSSRSFGLTAGPLPNLDDPSTYVFQQAVVPGHPHAGVLSTPVFLARYPSTNTNRNRHRARVFFDRFLATDLLALAERPIDPNASAYHNATLNDPQCTVCHAIMDPVAGAFQNWDNDGDRRVPEDGWYPDLAPPGFGETLLPASERADALGWLGEQAAVDPRFPIAMAELVFEFLTGHEVLASTGVSADPTARAVIERQRAFFDTLASAFVASNYDLRVLFTEIVLSPWYRATASLGADAAVEATAGTFRLRTPESLSRAIEATTAYPWSPNATSTPYLLDRYRLLYGGIDSDAVTARLTQPNGLMVNIAERMSVGAACRAVPYEFVLDAPQRRLFPFVEMSFTPLTPEGFEVPQAELAIRQNIAHLFDVLLGERVDANGVEVDAAYALFFETWQEGQAGLDEGTIDVSLPWACQANNDFWTGESFDDRRVRNDENYVLRSWMAVMSYLLGDVTYLYE